jgi:urease accessory protein
MNAVAGQFEIAGAKPAGYISRWEARLQLGLNYKHGKTVLSRRRHHGPLTLQRPFYPEDNGTCHLYVLHPPGGIVGGDSLDISIVCDVNTSTLITTPAANKFYQSNGHTAWQNQDLTVRGDGCLEWLPQETILFDGARVNSATKILLDDQASFFGWEIVSFGRPACNEEFTIGLYKQSYEIWKDSEPLLIDRVTIKDRAEVFNSAWGFRKQPVMGLLTVVNNNPTLLEEAKLRIQSMIIDVSCLSVTIMGSVLVCRCLDCDSMAIRDKFIEIWKAIRLIAINKEPCAPRIWAT